VIDRIDNGFFNGRVREVLDAGCFGAIGMLDNGFRNQVTLDVVERIAGSSRVIGP
jgi:hypothetical protein